MRILMMSKNGDGLGIAQKLVEEGHDVKVWTKERGFEWPLMGIVDHVSGWRRIAAEWADFIFADMVGFGHHAVTLDRFGKPHLGFNQVGDMLELDRHRQMELLRRAGVRLPETHELDGPSAGADILSLWTSRTPGFVIKPSGNLDTGKTFVCETKEVFEWALEQFAADQELVVQRIVEGIEISTEGWFTGSGWIPQLFNHTFEEKKLFEGDLGPNTGCMGNVVIQAPNIRKNKLVMELKKLTPALAAAKYKGPVDLNCIVNEEGLNALEITARFGYDAIEALHSMMERPLLGFFLNLAAGEAGEMTLKKGHLALAVRVTIPPYPNGDAEKDDRGLPITGLPKNLEGIYLTDVYRDGKLLKWAATDGVLLKVAASSKTIDGARRIVYDQVRRIKTLDLQYRRDIGDRVPKALKQLKKWRVF